MHGEGALHQEDEIVRWLVLQMGTRSCKPSDKSLASQLIQDLFVMSGQSREFPNNRRGRGGVYRGRGAGRGGFYGATRITNLLDGLKEAPLLTVERPSASNSNSQETGRISNVRPVASYNWADYKQPTIIIPGSFSSVHFLMTFFNN